jgi:hypothetical protein
MNYDPVLMDDSADEVDLVERFEALNEVIGLQDTDFQAPVTDPQPVNTTSDPITLAKDFYAFLDDPLNNYIAACAVCGIVMSCYQDSVNIAAYSN